ncbi:hypothetical protein N9Y17_01075 [Gammaproteobacteria bacterium]|nr:hypothetical protein [Gammaproteobacteria bacterium]
MKNSQSSDDSFDPNQDLFTKTLNTNWLVQQYIPIFQPIDTYLFSLNNWANLKKSFFYLQKKGTINQLHKTLRRSIHRLNNLSRYLVINYITQVFYDIYRFTKEYFGWVATEKKALKKIRLIAFFIPYFSLITLLSLTFMLLNLTLQWLVYPYHQSPDTHPIIKILLIPIYLAWDLLMLCAHLMTSIIGTLICTTAIIDLRIRPLITVLLISVWISLAFEGIIFPQLFIYLQLASNISFINIFSAITLLSTLLTGSKVGESLVWLKEMFSKQPHQTLISPITHLLCFTLMSIIAASLSMLAISTFTLSMILMPVMTMLTIGVHWQHFLPHKGMDFYQSEESEKIKLMKNKNQPSNHPNNKENIEKHVNQQEINNNSQITDKNDLKYLARDQIDPKSQLNELKGNNEIMIDGNLITIAPISNKLNKQNEGRRSSQRLNKNHSTGKRAKSVDVKFHDTENNVTSVAKNISLINLQKYHLIMQKHEEKQMKKNAFDKGFSSSPQNLTQNTAQI